MVPESLLNDIIGGFAAGIAVSIVVGIYMRVNKWFKRRDQIGYLRVVMERGIDLIDTAETAGLLHLHLQGSNVSVSPDQLRHTYYQSLKRTLNATIHGRSSEIKPEEIMDLNEALHSLDWVIENDLLAPKTLYDQTFKRVKTLQWLW